MHTFLSARVQHSTLIQRKLQFSYQPFTALPKPPVDLQGTSVICGSKTTLFWMMSIGHYTKASMDWKCACMGSVIYKNMQTLTVQHKPIVLPCVCVCVCLGGRVVRICFIRGAKCLRQLCEVMPKWSLLLTFLCFFFFFVFGICTILSVWSQDRTWARATARLHFLHLISVTEYCHGNRWKWVKNLLKSKTSLIWVTFLHFPFHIFSIFATFPQSSQIKFC